MFLRIPLVFTISVEVERSFSVSGIRIFVFTKGLKWSIQLRLSSGKYGTELLSIVCDSTLGGTETLSTTGVLDCVDMPSCGMLQSFNRADTRLNDHSFIS